MTLIPGRVGHDRLFLPVSNDSVNAFLLLKQGKTHIYRLHMRQRIGLASLVLATMIMI